MRNRFLILVCTLQACSNVTAQLDAGADAAPDVAPTTDASSDGDAGALSVPQALDQAGKLALWVEATASDVTLGDGGVATWKDKSKNHNDAVATNALPVLQSGVLAGHDAVHFGLLASALTMKDSPSFQFGTDQTHIVAVARTTRIRAFFFQKVTEPTDGAIFSGLSFFIANAGFTDAGGVALSPYGSLSGVDSVQWGSGNELADGNFHIISFRRIDATNIEVWIDDLAPRKSTVAPVDVNAPGEPAVFGNTDNPSPDMSIAEELILHDATGIVSDADVASVHAYLKQKYGL